MTEKKIINQTSKIESKLRQDADEFIKTTKDKIHKIGIVESAKILDVTPGLVSQWVNGKKHATIEKWINISDILAKFD